MAINAVFESWNNQRAITYRKLYSIPDNWGTAVNVQTMVFGNMGDTSGTGVAFTRNPATGEKKFYGEFLMNAQGEDVVAGIRTPQSIEKLKERVPEVYESLVEIYQKLENHYKDMQDIEFTIQDRKLYMLQTRTGKRTAAAAVRIAVEMVKEGLVDKKTAILRVEPEQLDQLLHPIVDPKAKVEVIAKGLPASPGAGIGKVVFTTEAAQEMASKGEKVILVRQETSPEDIAGMNMSQGILTVTGGMTSHAAIISREFGIPSIVGAKMATQILKNGQVITVGPKGSSYFAGGDSSVSDFCKEIYAFESVESAVSDAAENAKLNEINNVHFITADLYKSFLPLQKKSSFTSTAYIL